MKAELGRPYNLPKKPPFKVLKSERNTYALYELNGRAVEIFEIVGDSIKQRFTLTKDKLNGFEKLATENGYEKQTTNL